MKSLILTSLLVLFVASSAYGAEPVGKIISVKGTAFVAKLLKPKKAAVIGMEIHEKDKVKTEADGAVQIEMLNGTKLSVSGANGYLKIPKNSKGKKGETKLALYGGKVGFEVKKLGQEQSFSIRTPSAVAGVRGTEGGVSFDLGSGITGSQAVPHTDGRTDTSEVWTAPAGPGVEAQLNNAIRNDKAGGESGHDHEFTKVTEGQGSFHMPNGDVFLIDMEPGQDLLSAGDQVAKDAKDAASGAKSNARFRNMDENMIAYLEDLEARLNNINPPDSNDLLPSVPSVPAD